LEGFLNLKLLEYLLLFPTYLRLKGLLLLLTMMRVYLVVASLPAFAAIFKI